MTAASSQISGAVAIHPVYLQFLLQRERLQPGDALRLPGHSMASLYLTSLLRNHTLFTVPNLDNDPPSAATARLDYIITPQMAEQGQYFLTSTDTARFNAFLKNMMHQTLFDRVDTLTTVGMQEKKVIEGFMDEFALEVEFDTLKKACTRRRERLGIMPLKTRKDGRPNREGGEKLCQPCNYYNF